MLNSSLAGVHAGGNESVIPTPNIWGKSSLIDRLFITTSSFLTTASLNTHRDFTNLTSSFGTFPSKIAFCNMSLVIYMRVNCRTRVVIPCLLFTTLDSAEDLTEIISSSFKPFSTVSWSALRTIAVRTEQCCGVTTPS